jgi:hypothetical protein
VNSAPPASTRVTPPAQTSPRPLRRRKAVLGGVVRVALGTLGPGAYGEVCYQARIR